MTYWPYILDTDFSILLDTRGLMKRKRTCLSLEPFQGFRDTKTFQSTNKVDYISSKAFPMVVPSIQGFGDFKRGLGF